MSGGNTLSEAYGSTEQRLKGVLIAFKQLKDPGNIRAGVAEHRLAQIYLALKQYNKSEEAFKNALSIMQQQIGSQHPYYAITLQDYAKLLLLTNTTDHVVPPQYIYTPIFLI